MKRAARLTVIGFVMAFSSLCAMEGSAQLVLFQDDFEDGTADGWGIEEGWEVERHDDNYVLSGTGHYFVRPGVDGWSDCTIEARARILSGGFHFNFRESTETDHIRYFLELLEGGSDLLKQIGSDFLYLPGPGIVIPPDTWHTVRITLAGPNIRIYVDDVLKLNYTDTDNPILFGKFSFETLDDTHVHLDDIIVTDLSQPEVVCGSDGVSEGSLFSLDVNLLHNASRVAGFQFNLAYDESLLQAIDVTYGDLLSRDSGAAYYNEPTIDSAGGKIRGILSARTSTGGLRGDGILCTITFKAVRAGESSIDLQSVKLCDPIGQRIEATTTNGTVSVHSEPGSLLTVKAFCSVDLIVADPKGRMISRDESTIPWATYTEEDLNNDSDLDDKVTIPDPLSGDYSIEVTPEPGAVSTDTYILDISYNGETTRLAENVAVGNIPDEPYSFSIHHNWVVTLSEGWNLFSFPVSKCFYEGAPPTDQPACVELVNIADLGFSSMAEWFDSILTPVNPVSNPWRIVIGTNGVMDSTLSPSSHSLKYMTVTAGYWVKIEEAAGGANLSLQGASFDSGCAIPLMDGWSIISYPLNTGYYDTATAPTIPGMTNWVQVPRPVGAHVFGSIAGKYRIIIGQQGVYDPTLSPASSSLRWIVPCTAYWIKMNEPWDLVYANMGATSLPLAASPPVNQTIIGLPLLHESRFTPSNTLAVVYGSVTQGGIDADVGAHVQVFTQEGTLCGETTATHRGQYGMMLVYGDDALTTEIEGAQLGEELTFYVNGAQAQTEGDVYWLGAKSIQCVELVSQSRPQVSMLAQNYPNPFNPDTWIPYQLSEDAHVEIKIYTSTGQLVRTLNVGRMSAGSYMDKEKAAYWNGRNEAGESVASGIYFYSIEAGGFSAICKMMAGK